MIILKRLQNQEKKLNRHINNFTYVYVETFKSKLVLLSLSDSSLIEEEHKMVINRMIKTCDTRLFLLS